MSRRTVLAVLASALAAVVVPGSAGAQPAYPAKQLRMILPVPAGGPSDVAARALSQSLARALGVPVVVENRPGAGGALAAQAAMSAAPDGGTVLWTLGSMSGLPAVMKTPPYQAITELTPVSMVGYLVYAMFVHPDTPSGSVREFIGYAKAHPDKLSCATGTLGDYMATVKFLQATGTRCERVNYKGGMQLMPDLVGGRVQVNFGPLSTGVQPAGQGKLRVLGVMTPVRSAAVPEVPTFGESGLGAVAIPSWQAVFAPPGTPPEIAERLSREIGIALKDGPLRAQLEQLHLQVASSTPAELAAIATRATQDWREFARDFDIPKE